MPPGSESPTVPERRPAATGEPTDRTLRLHPMTPIALGGRILGLMIVLTAFNLAESRNRGSIQWPQLAIYGAIAIIVVTRGAVTVAVTRYHVRGNELRIDNGLFSKQSKRVRLDRVQSIDVLEPFSARVFRLAEVKITTAGSERSAVRLRYLSRPVAVALRADLLGRASGSGEGAPESPERRLVAVPDGLLVGSVLLQTVSWRLIFLAVGPLLTVLGQQNGHKATTGLGVTIIVLFVIALLHSIWSRLSSLWEFTVSDSADGLRLRHGMLSTTRQTVPAGRIQAILIHQPLTWRPFGWVQVRMNVAGYGNVDSSKRTMLLPVVDRGYAEQLVGWLFGGVDPSSLTFIRPPRRAAFRSPLWWRGQWAGADERVFVAKHGLLSRTVDFVPHGRTQSLRLSAGPLERALGLASLYLDSTRGPVKTRVRNRDADDARHLLETEIDLRHRATRLETGQPAPSDYSDDGVSVGSGNGAGTATGR